MKLRMPMRPLVRLVALTGGPTVAIRRATLEHRETRRLYALYHRGERSGLLTVGAADELAVRLLGLHPALVWGETWWLGGSGRPTDRPAQCHRNERSWRGSEVQQMPSGPQCRDDLRHVSPEPCSQSAIREAR
jgi:hypothetical protein